MSKISNTSTPKPPKFHYMKITSISGAKNVLTAMAALLFVSSAFGQEGVKKQVRNLHSSGTQFETVQPFASAEMKSAKAFEELDIAEEALTDATVLQPATEAIAELELLQPEFVSMQIPTPDGKEATMELELYRESIFTDDIRIESSDQDGVALPVPDAVFYRGAVKGATRSLVAVTVLDGELSGMIALDGETYVLGRVKEAKSNEHVMYRKDDLNLEEEFTCTALESDNYEIPEEPAEGTPKTTNCVRMRIEIDNGLVTGLGGVSAATNYVTSLFNQVITLYANDGIDVSLAEIYAWNGSSPYTGGLADRLYQMTHTSSNADLTQLLTNVGGGGIAWLSGLCSNNYAVSVAGIYGYFSNVPGYSWDVNVCTHEIGHNLSSPHTHACAWNGNNTPIDGCGAAVGYSEGCTGSIPSGGGTIMSYCHLTYAGMNFNLGFGPQPKARIQNYVNSRPCLTSGCGGGSSTCTNNELSLNINFDNQPQQTSWEITDDNNIVLASGDDYNGQTSTQEDICLPDGCYTLTFFDSYGNGMCCGSGSGNFSLNDVAGNQLAQGSQYDSRIDLSFCVGDASPNCEYIDFNDYTINSYASNRDIGTYTILDGGKTLYLQNNALKSIALNYDVTPNTVLEFDFKSTDQADVHGIGFDNNNGLTLQAIYKIHGTLNNNKLISDYDTYSGSGYVNYQIPVGNYHYGSYLTNLFFIATKRNTPGDGNSYFKNVRVYEAGQCGSSMPDAPSASVDGVEKDGFVLFPNPTQDHARLISSGDAEIEVVRIYNSAGTLVDEWKVNGPAAELNMADRAQGLYLITWTDNHGQSHQERLVKTQ